jgi:predicted phage terminase large subunit-like protein
MYSQCAKIEAGHVLLPSDAPWLPLFKSELLQFPHGKYDDQVDSFSQLLAWMAGRTRFASRPISDTETMR